MNTRYVKSIRLTAGVILALLAVAPHAVSQQRQLALAARHLIDLNGNNLSADSFDSKDPLHSTAGQYDATKAKDNGDVAANDGLRDSSGVGNANLYGHAHVGPFASVALGSAGGIGTHVWQASHPGQIEPGYFSEDANTNFPDQPLPYTTGLLPTWGTLSVTNFVVVTNAVFESPAYPSPPPPDGVVTNVYCITTNTWPDQPGTTTNYNTTYYKNQAYPPAPGTYIPPCSIITNSAGSVRYSYYHIDSIASYTYLYYTYTYNLCTTNASVTNQFYDHILLGGDYCLDTLSGKTIVLAPSRLVALNGVNLSGNDVLLISPQASLSLYAGGNSCVLGGNGVVNQNGYAVSCQIRCAPTVLSLDFAGNGLFIGVVVAPQAQVRMNNAAFSSPANDFVGSLVCDSVTLYGEFSFHWDEALASADFTYTANGNGITLTKYTGDGGALMIPPTILGMPVTSLGSNVFNSCTRLSSVTIPDSVTWIGNYAFWLCTNLTDVTIPASVTTIGNYAFASCTSLKNIYFSGNAPVEDSSMFSKDDNATVYYLPGTTNWGTKFGGLPAVPWQPSIQPSDASFQTPASQFGFTIHWASGRVIVVDACTDLANATWVPLQTNLLTTGSCYFSDPGWTNYPARLYRLRSL